MTPARSSLTVSFLLVPGESPAERWPWLPLLTGIAAAGAVRRVTGVEVDLKWPNDVLADGHKLGGILLERVEHDGTAAAVVGVGHQLRPDREELPVPEATSLALVTGGSVDRSALLAALVEELAERYDEWRAGADLRAAYLELCRTPGRGGAGRGAGRRGGRSRPSTWTRPGGSSYAPRPGRSTSAPGTSSTSGPVSRVTGVTWATPWHDLAVVVSRKLLNEGEHVMLSTRTHVKALLLPAVVLILVAGWRATSPACRRRQRRHLALGDLGDRRGR